MIDSGASKHMFALKDSFNNIKESAIESVKLGDGRKVISGMSGTVPLCTMNGNTRIRLLLHDVMFVPGLDTNLVSCAELIKQGYTISFCQDSCDIQKSGKLVATASLKNGLYVLNRKNCAQNDEVANLSSTSLKGIRLWHLRFGLVNTKSLKTMIRKELVHGISLSDKAVTGNDCDDCVKGKLPRLTMKSRTLKAREIGETVYSDVCGLVQVRSIGGSHYFVTFTDEYSGLQTVEILREKSDVAKSFVRFQKRFERQNGCLIKSLYSDHGPECEALSDYLAENGIHNEYSEPHTPQQNGVAERLNRTLMDMARSMLEQAVLPSAFWAEAVTTASYLGIKVPGSRRGRTPIEILTESSPSVKHLRVCGSEVWIHVPRQQRKKLDSKSRRGTLLRSLPRRMHRVCEIEKNVQLRSDMSLSTKPFSCPAMGNKVL